MVIIMVIYHNYELNFILLRNTYISTKCRKVNLLLNHYWLHICLDNTYVQNVPRTSACWRQFFSHSSYMELPLSLSLSLYITKPRSVWDSYIKLSHRDLNPLLDTNQWASSSKPEHNNFHKSFYLYNWYALLIV